MKKTVAPPSAPKRPAAPAKGLANFAAGTGEMAGLIRSFDWASTPLGPIETWPQSLRTVVRVLLNSHHPMYVFWGPELICLWNDAYTASIGPERHPVSLGQPAREVWDEIWPIIGPQIELVMAGDGATWNVNQLVPITRNGQRDDVYWTYGYSPIDDDAAPNGVGGVLVVCNETTDQVLLAQRLADQASARTQERDRLAALFEQAPGFMTLLSGPDHRFELVNQAYITLLDGRDVLGRTVAEAVPEAGPQGFIELLDTVYRTGEAFKSRGARLALTGGSGQLVERYLDFIYQPIRDETGAITGIFVEGSDTTDRTLAERDFARTERLLRSLIETGPGYFYFKDVEGRMLMANQAIIELVGKPWSEIEGRTDVEFLEDKSQGRVVMENDRAILAAGMAQEIEERVTNAEGEPRLFLSTKSPLRGEDGEIIGLVGVSVDITARKELETQLQVLNTNLEAEVQSRTMALEEAAQALRQSQKMEAIGQLTGGIAHDFNNMLQGVVGGIALAKRRLETGRAHEVDKYLDGAAEAAARAAALTARLLAFGRRQSLDAKPINIDALLTGMGDLINRTVGPEIDIDLRLKDGCWPVLVDRNQLENAVLNLCINARDAMPTGGQIVIEASHVRLEDRDTTKWEDAEPGDYLCISVSDSGVGMPSDVAAHAFEPFFTTKPEGQGTGLGLSQIYGFVRQSHGLVQLDSAVGEGTTVKIFLPRHDGVAERTPASAGAAAPTAPADAPRRILLVEDEVAILGPSTDALRDLGYEVVTASNGGQALEVLNAKAAPPDLLITDVGLPGGLNGRQLADAARQMLPQLPVLLITGYAGDAIAGRARLEPGMQLLNKPFDLADLATRVEAMLSAKG